MAASRLDLEWDRGGDWERIVYRRTRWGVVLPLTSAVLEIRPVDTPSVVAPLVAVAGQVDALGKARLRVDVEHMEQLPASGYEHRVLITDAASLRRMVLLRGYVTLLDTVGAGV